MLTSPVFVLLLIIVSAIAQPSSHHHLHKPRSADAYIVYYGDGGPENGWPNVSAWVDWTTMFNTNKPIMRTACANLGIPVAESTEDEIGKIWDAVLTVSNESGVDPRFIFAVILQESGGCVRVWATGGGSLYNPGLMQSHNGVHNCNTGLNSVGYTQYPCPWYTITNMVRDGVGESKDGTGLKDILTQVQEEIGTDDARAYYSAARIYNSGSLDPTNLDIAFASTRCYAMDIANRLTGWVHAVRACPY